MAVPGHNATVYVGGVPMQITDIKKINNTEWEGTLMPIEPTPPKLDPFLLRAVLDRPSDMLPRKVLADWCQESGYPELGRLIQLQTSFQSRLEPSIEKECSQLIQKHGDDWAFYAIPKNVGNYRPYSYTSTGTYAEWLSISSFADLVAITHGFPSHWRGTVADWMGTFDDEKGAWVGGVGSTCIRHYPIKHVEFTDVQPIFIDREPLPRPSEDAPFRDYATELFRVPDHDALVFYRFGTFAEEEVYQYDGPNIITAFMNRLNPMSLYMRDARKAIPPPVLSRRMWNQGGYKEEISKAAIRWAEGQAAEEDSD